MDELPDIENSARALRRPWFVLHVKPRTEKKAAALLAGARIFAHLPVYVKETRVQRRRIRRELPLFPGYVFVRLSPDERRSALATRLVVRILDVPRPREMIHQLRQIGRASRLAPAFKTVNPFHSGELVRVASGPFRGLEGRVRRNGPAATIVLNLEVLGRAVETAISPADCEPAGEGR